MKQIRCGNCTETHTSIAAVRACHTGDLFACHWAVEYPGRWVVIDEETGESDFIEGGIGDCGAEAIVTERGWTCSAGHEHVTAETRHSEGWDYAECFEEAAGMYRVGVEPRTMSGHLVTNARDFVPVGAY